MVAETIQLLRRELEAFLRRKAGFGPTKEVVGLVHFADKEGKLVIPENLVGVCLFNLDEERIMKSQGMVANRHADRVAFLQPEVRLNLYLLFAANFADYNESLKFIGWTVAFFQSKRVFNRQNSPTMPVAMAELVVDLYTMTLEQQNYLWSILGAKYVPSAAYQVRPVVIQEGQVELDQSPVLEINIAAGRQQ
jgi:hypothetical protein